MGTFFGREGAEFGRGLGFFDAIYGFAITLLISNVDLPPADAWNSLGSLLASGVGNQLTGFVVSFVVIAVFWRLNTVMLARFTGFDSAVITANLVTAALVVLIPFTTQGISDPVVSEHPLATALYAVNVALAIASMAVIHEVGRARGLIDDEVPRSARWATRLDELAKVGVFVVSIPVAYLAGANWGQLTWVLMIPVGLLSGRWSARVVARAVARERSG